MKNFTIITFEYGEPVTALYIDGLLHLEGDEYHNDISSRIEGFIEGCIYAGLEFEKFNKRCIDEQLNSSITEMGFPVPTLLKDIKLKDEKI